MKLEKILAIVALVGCAACGGTKNTSREVMEPPVQLKEAYYITEVGGTQAGGITHNYHFELKGEMQGLRFDSVWVSETQLPLMLMPGRPLIRAMHSFQPTRNFQPPSKARLRGYKKDKVFYLETDSLYEKEKIYMPSAHPGKD